MNYDKYQYREFNPDLNNLTDDELLKHFDEHCFKETRIYIDKFFNKELFCAVNNFNINDEQIYLKYTNDIRQQKNNIFNEYIKKLNKLENTTILLVNHDDNLYGASHYLYNLFNILKKAYNNVLLCEIKYNPIILSKYNIDIKDVLEYENDPTLLYMVYEYYLPKLIYFNSINYAITKVIKYIPKNKRILHSHECYENYSLALELPNFVVSDKIAQRYQNNEVKIQPPFLSNIDDIIIKSTEPIEEITNKKGIFDKNKITIGMCGQISERKNYKLFIKVSILYPNYNFMWIGDTIDNGNIFDNYENIYHISNTENPYKYYKQLIDYFMLFSIIDPCPYVILENILLNNNIIVFNPNILYNHNDISLKSFYHIYPYEISLYNCSMAINRYVKNKKIINNINFGQIYIRNKFSYPNEVMKTISQFIN